MLCFSDLQYNIEVRISVVHGLDELLRNSKLKEGGSYVEPENQPKFDSSELLIIRSEIPWHY